MVIQSTKTKEKVFKLVTFRRRHVKLALGVFKNVATNC